MQEKVTFRACVLFWNLVNLDLRGSNTITSSVELKRRLTD